MIGSITEAAGPGLGWPDDKNRDVMIRRQDAVTMRNSQNSFVLPLENARYLRQWPFFVSGARKARKGHRYLYGLRRAKLNDGESRAPRRFQRRSIARVSHLRIAVRVGGNWRLSGTWRLGTLRSKGVFCIVRHSCETHRPRVSLAHSHPNAAEDGGLQKRTG